MRDLTASLPLVVGRTFDRMAIAEEMIESAKDSHPLRRSSIDRVFGAACPPESMRDKGDDLYRAHIAELIERARKDEDPRPPTLAEIVGHMSNVSLTAPPGPIFAALYERIFERLFPLQAGSILRSGRTAESWSGACDQLLAEMRRKLADPSMAWSDSRLRPCQIMAWRRTPSGFEQQNGAARITRLKNGYALFLDDKHRGSWTTLQLTKQRALELTTS